MSNGSFESWRIGNGVLVRGDCADVLPRFLGYFTAMVTDPPYGLSFMNKKWDYDGPSVNVWKKCLAALRPGAHALIFAGSRTQHRMAVNVEDAGFQLKDCLMWLYGSGFPKGLDVSRAIDKKAGVLEAAFWNGRKTHLKPAYEPVILAMKPNDGNYVENALKHGVAGLNIEGCRIESEKSTGWDGRPVSGRYPANVLLDEEAAAMLDEQAGVRKSGARKAGIIKKGSKNCYGEYKGYECASIAAEIGGASRFFYTAKASPSERGGINKHPTVKPLKLMEYLCKLVSSPRDTVIVDPFAGSGTTALACERLGLSWLAIERESEYCEIIRGRLECDINLK